MRLDCLASKLGGVYVGGANRSLEKSHHLLLDYRFHLFIHHWLIRILLLANMEVIESQKAFLQASYITPETVAKTLRPLLSERENGKESDVQRNRWLSIAVLQALTEPSRVFSISSIQTATELLDVGITASLNFCSQDDASFRHVRTVLLTMDNSLRAWTKTTMFASREDPDSDLLEDGQTDGSGDVEQDQDVHADDEDSAWFDTQAETSSSASADERPVVSLSVLLLSLQQPIKTAMLLTPWPSRLAIWLRALDPALFDKYIWQHHDQVVGAILMHIALAMIEPTDALALLRKERLLPTMREANLWADLHAAAVGSTSILSELASLLQSSTNDKPRTDLSKLDEANDHVKFWYETQALAIERNAAATLLAAKLAIIGQESCAEDDSSGQQALRKLSQELMICYKLGQPMTEIGSGTDMFPRRLLDDPVNVLHDQLASEADVADEATIRAALDYLSISADHSHDRSEVARRLCWKLVDSRDNALKSQRPVAEIIMLVQRATDASEAERDLVILSILATRCSVEESRAWGKLLNFGQALTPVSIEVKKLIIEQLKKRSQLDFSHAASENTSPTANEIYQILTDPNALHSQVLVVRRRLLTWLDASSDPLFLEMFSVGHLSPWHCVTFAQEESLQLQALRETLHGMSKLMTSSSQWINLARSCLKHGGGGRLFDALQACHISQLLLSSALHSQNTSEDNLRSLVGEISSWPLEVEDIIINTIASVRGSFDRAPGGRHAMGELRKVRTVLQSTQTLTTTTQQSSVLDDSIAFVNAVVRLMHVSPPLSSTLHPAVLMTPVEIRLTRTKLDVIRRWLSLGGDKAWRREQDVVETASGLCSGALSGALGEAIDNDQLSQAAAPKAISASTAHGKAALIVQVMAMLADAAIAANDFHFVTTYLEKMLSAFADLKKRSRHVSARADREQLVTEVAQRVEQASETVWTTLFTISKHPNCQDADLRKQWLGQAIAFAPPDRLADLLKRWRELAATEAVADENEEAEMTAAVTLAMKAQQQRGAGRVAGLDFGGRMPTASRAAQAASGLGAGVFSLAAAAVNSSHWPLSRGKNSGEASSSPHEQAQASLGSALGFGGSSVSGALSSLTGQLGEGYGNKLTSLWGGASPVTPVPPGEVAGTNGEVGILRASRPSSSSRTAAALFDGLDSSSKGSRSESPSSGSQHASYLDPAERAAKAARGFLSGFRGAGNAGSPRLGLGELEGGEQQSGAGSGSGWAALSSRGVGWLMGEEEVVRGQSQY